MQKVLRTLFTGRSSGSAEFAAHGGLLPLRAAGLLVTATDTEWWGEGEAAKGDGGDRVYGDGEKVYFMQ